MPGLCRAVVLAVLLSVHALAGAASPFDAPLTLRDSAQWDVRAAGNGTTYRIFVAWPDRPPPASGYRVLYVMDGNAMFLTAVEAVRTRTGDRPRGDPAHAAAVAREIEDALTVVVGIGYPPDTSVAVARKADLTPAGLSDPTVPEATGGAGEFLDFIEQELKPVIEERFRIDRDRQAIFGHSLGGLFVLHTLVERPDAFQTYLAASPSIWYANHAILERIDAFAAARTAATPPLRVLLTAAEYEQALDPALRDTPGAQARAADMLVRGQVTYGRQVAERLDALPGVEAGFVEFAGETHASVIPSAIGRGVRTMMAAAAPVELSIPEMPTAQGYYAMTAEERYALRLQVRALPDSERIPWVTRQYHVLHDGSLSEEQLAALHEERNRMDQLHGTRPHLNNAQLDTEDRE